jgi:hypothetical protein
MIKVVIWMNLNAPSLCTYQLWCFLILKCSTCQEDSIDYKFVIFLISRTKDMNYLVLKCYLNHLNVTSKFCTVTMWYSCIFGFYTFVAFQRHIICYFWISRTKDMNFWSLGTNLFFNSKKKSYLTEGLATWHFPIGRYRFGDGVNKSR